jgi:hypothetical protein
VALIAGQVGNPPAALSLDQVKGIDLEGDGGVEVLDAQTHVADSDDPTHPPILRRFAAFRPGCG